MDKLGVFFAALVLSVLVEALLEYALGIWWTPLSETVRPKIIMAVGLALGVVLCLAYKVDLIAELGMKSSAIGQILTGALVGRGSDYLHKIWDKLKP